MIALREKRDLPMIRSQLSSGWEPDRGKKNLLTRFRLGVLSLSSFIIVNTMGGERKNCIDCSGKTTKTKQKVSESMCD